MDNQAMVGQIKAQLATLDQQQHQQFVEGEAIGVLLAARAHEVDLLLQRLWQQFELGQQGLALVAVGGYGRGELHPRSDIDLLLLTSEQPTAEQEQRLGVLLTTLWDARLEIGHSVRSVAETLARAQDDVTIATNLLESRLLCGDQTLYSELQQGLLRDDFWPSADFFQAKFEEQELRHSKSTPFDLEPNIKSCPGGLRDVQTITWVALRHFNASCLAELVSHGYLTQEELEELGTCRDYLWRLRFALHLVAGRAEEKLLFDRQRDVAKLMGYSDETQLAVEQMMKRYYRTVRAVRELNQMLLLLFQQATLDRQALPAREPLSERFDRRGHYIEARRDDIFAQPDNLLALFLDALEHPAITTISASTLRLLRNARRTLAAPLSERAECRQLFMAILKHPQGFKALSLMHRHGILGAYLEPWQHITGQMQFDLFHAYTVDEHTHRLLQFIERFSNPEHKSIFPLGSVLIDQLPKKGLLVLAAIFHDIGKGRGGDHSDIGAEEAKRFCQQHGMNEHDGRLVAWLVQHHLLMSVTAQRRDITDPEVIETFANQVKDQTQLAYLYCLTVADICATNNSLWNNWKGSLLRELYHASRERLLNGSMAPVDGRARIREHQAKARNQLLRQGFEQADIDQLWQRFSADYFLRFTPAQIQWHSEHLLSQPDEPHQVQLSVHMTRGGTELFVYAPDSPGLFTRVMTVLDAKRLSVHDAQIFTTRDGYALDSFVILEHDGAPVQSPSRIASIRKSLLQALRRAQAPSRALRPLSRKLRSFQVPTRVKFLNNHRKNSSMVELVTLDRPGLLAQIGEVFEQCGIEVKAAKITTVGEKAEDFFLLSTPEGEALSPPMQHTLRSALTEALEQDTLSNLKESS
ncbi:[protein-PII] uridylyltransferase [Ferrimonas marina]|uniref:Bifunctional uridylyltransferase/uridylyl-removing enzyme n=1 Tax=Ferrimonas marina TaxID=299255 RepID=A0A1M5YFK7_9GAMM|nr:[protein-PII] uridylyltransferase [Ferrimonas marina]SHI10825.1 UTP--GlnB (protein PII) uridylyltransferase, GlnD [Ferrimonas marina]